MKHKFDYIFFILVLLAVLVSGFADKNVVKKPDTTFSEDNCGDYLSFGALMGGGNYNDITYEFSVSNVGRFDLKNITVHIYWTSGVETLTIGYLAKDAKTKLSVRLTDENAEPLDGILQSFMISKVSASGEIVR